MKTFLRRFLFASKDGTSQRGVVALLFVIIILLIGSGLTLSVVPTFTNTVKILKNISYSQQAYYAAEAGVEDAAHRISNSIAYPSSYTLNVGSGQTAVTVTTVGLSKTIESDGNQQNRLRKIQSTISISSERLSFQFGAQAGAQGVSMGTGSSITGGVFSNGNIVGAAASKDTISGTVQASGSSSIQKVTVTGDAYANTFSDCSVGGRAYYAASITNCPAQSTQHLAGQVDPVPLPIPQSDIDQWKNDALAGGTPLNGYTLGNNTSGSLGPIKVNGDITLGNSTTLTITGTVWVTGTIHLGNTDIIQLDSGYGTNSGLIIFDGAATMKNSVIIKGSGQAGSDILLLSTFGPGTAFTIGTTAQVDIFYASTGVISISNGAAFREIVGDGLALGNNVDISYQSTPLNINFTTGPGGSWKITSWKEVP
jgi:Tfp pilus assembly protein PilX